ncbi:MAG: hypothetical protein HY908_27630 [Myxococcales bacterium]|nr:hypothetical protein [Myxococcales bacterium]
MAEHLTPTLCVVTRLPGDPRARRACEVAVALALCIPLREAQTLLRPPVRLPLPQDGPAATLARSLRDAGAEVSESPARTGAERCADHPRFVAEAVCAVCGTVLCVLCAASSPELRCRRCGRKKARWRTFYLVRVAVLLAVLAGVVLYAVRELRDRSARTGWSRTLSVAIVVVEAQPLAPGLAPAVRERIDALGQRLTGEMRRYRPDGPAPFVLEVFGPLRLEGPLGETSTEGVDDAEAEARLKEVAARADAAAGIATRIFDSRIYLVARPPARADRESVEGFGQQGGKIGLVNVELDGSMVDFALFVAAHELFHNLGASDKYDPSGNPTVPDGLGEPELVPRYPQRLSELMGRHRATGPGASVPPAGLEELTIGSATAREIGWLEALTR